MAVAAGERRIVTVLFADLVDSTSIAERLGAERSKFLVDEVMRVMSAEVERFDGTVAGFAGDELYAVFGAPRSHEDDSERAVRAALAIQRALERYAGEVREAYGIELAARIAINTGPVVIQPDSDEPYNALGDTANIAARIQKLVEGGEVVVARQTKLQVETCFALESLGAQALKGLAQPVETFKVVGPAVAVEPRPLQPLVGRDFEVSVLERSFDSLVDGRGAIVAVMGEPGIGKTRLVAELRAAYGERVRFVEGRAVSYAQSFAYWPIRDLLREWLGVGAATPEARVRLELKAQLAEVFGADADDVYPFVATLLGIQLEPVALQRLRELNRESIQTRTFEVVAELVCRLSRDTPLCLVLDDLHWADESTLDLLEHLLSVTDDAAVALLLLYRTEREHRSWRLGEFARQRYPHRYRELELRPLPADASRSLATTAAGAELPESVAELLAERAGGNPFFLEEALRDLVERGVLLRDDGRWNLAVREDELVVPALVQGALQARLDRLDAATREVVSTAAVAGRTFGLPLLEAVLPRDQVQAALAELQRLELVVEVRRRPVAEYRFRHGLVQEVAYASLVETSRRRLHLQLGEAIEALTADAPEQAVALLARHFSEGDDAGRAADYLLKAGDAARAVFAEQEAVAHYERARAFLARTGDETRARETLFKIALARHLAFDFPRAEDAYDEAFCCGVEEPVRLEPTERIETAIVAIGEQPLVPGYVYSTESAAITAHLFRGLLAVDRDLNVMPALADNLRVSSDGLTYLFRIRDGARWSDGEPVTAEDFAWTWRQMRAERATTAFLLAGVEARALDERTLEVTLDRPRSSFPFVLASVWMFPWPKHVCERLGPAWREPANLVCNGPYLLAEQTDEHLLLLANPHYVGPRGNVREIRISFHDRDRPDVEAWSEGRLDVLSTVWPAPASPDTEVETYAQLGLTFIGFHVGREPFSNELVRRAIAHGLDRARVAAALGTTSVPAVRGGAIPPAMPGHSHRVGIPYDRAEARRLLAEAGYPEGRGLPELRLLLHPWTRPEPFAELLAELGIRAEVEVAAGTIGCADVADKHLWFGGWTADYPDPEGLFGGLLASPWPFYRDEQIDDLLERSRVEHDQAARMRIFHELDRLWVGQHAAIVPVLYHRASLLRRPWVQGVWANPLWGPVVDTAVVTRGS
jgi:ABC-type transport system substrate-binding protein/class 3 adenylate cyclase